MSGAPSPLPERTAAPFLPQIESLRGYMALAVAYGHCTMVILFGLVPLSAAQRFLFHAVHQPLAYVLNGRYAVIVFFVISGLVLSLALDAAARFTPGDYARFVWRRALRIYPAHVAALALFVFAVGLTLFRMPTLAPIHLAVTAEYPLHWIDGTVYGRFRWLTWLLDATLYSDFYNPVTWTLQVEIVGSLFIPLFAFLSRPGRLGRDAAVLTLLIVGAALVVDADKRPDLFPSYLPAFYLGAMARTHGRRLCRGTPSRQLLHVAGAFALLVAGSGLAGPDRHIYASILVIAVSAFALVSIVAWGNPRHVGRLLLSPVSRWMGRLSYSFYLWHILVLFAFIRLLVILVPPDTLAGSPLALLAVTVAVTIPLSFLIAYVSWGLIERPFIALGKTVWKRRPAVAPAAAPGRPAEAIPCP